MGLLIVIALGASHLGTTYHTHTQILKHGRLLFGQCAYSLSLYKSSSQEKKESGLHFIKDRDSLMVGTAEYSFPVWSDFKTLEDFLGQV